MDVCDARTRLNCLRIIAALAPFQPRLPRLNKAKHEAGRRKDIEAPAELERLLEASED